MKKSMEKKEKVKVRHCIFYKYPLEAGEGEEEGDEDGEEYGDEDYDDEEDEEGLGKRGRQDEEDYDDEEDDEAAPPSKRQK